MLIEIRTEDAIDQARVHSIHRRAFGGSAEAGLVDRLRGEVAPLVSLVAEVGGQVAGAIGPVGVEPDLQGMGIGSALVRYPVAFGDL